MCEFPAEEQSSTTKGLGALGQDRPSRLRRGDRQARRVESESGSAARCSERKIRHAIGDGIAEEVDHYLAHGVRVRVEVRAVITRPQRKADQRAARPEMEDLPYLRADVVLRLGAGGDHYDCNKGLTQLRHASASRT